MICFVCGKESNSVTHCGNDEWVCGSCCGSCCCKCSLLSNITCARKILKTRMEKKLTCGSWYVIKKSNEIALRSAGSGTDVYQQIERECGAYRLRPFFITEKIYVFDDKEKQIYAHVHQGGVTGMSKENASALKELLKRGEEHDR